MKARHEVHSRYTEGAAFSVQPFSVQTLPWDSRGHIFTQAVVSKSHYQKSPEVPNPSMELAKVSVKLYSLLGQLQGLEHFRFTSLAVGPQHESQRAIGVHWHEPEL